SIGLPTPHDLIINGIIFELPGVLHIPGAGALPRCRKLRYGLLQLLNSSGEILYSHSGSPDLPLTVPILSFPETKSNGGGPWGDRGSTVKRQDVRAAKLVTFRVQQVQSGLGKLWQHREKSR